MPNAEEILDELHQIREELMEQYRGQPNEVFVRDMEAMAAKVYQELGIEESGPSATTAAQPVPPAAKK